MGTNSARRFLLRALDWLGRRIRVASDSRAEFYHGNEFCQISGLSGLYELYLSRKTNGTFVEVGANDGIYVSNTWGLAERGWNGLMIEPVPDLAAKCALNHKMHPRIKVVQTAVAAPGVDEVTLHLAGALTTASTDVVAEYASLAWAQCQMTDT